MDSLIERLRTTRLLSQRNQYALQAEAGDALEAQQEEIARLREALGFYADETAWNQPPVKTIAHELLGPAYENQASKVRMDRGRIARASLNNGEAN